MTKQAILLEWTESEAGWGQRPDGYSVHKDVPTAQAFIQAYWDRQHSAAAIGILEYSAPSDKANWKTITISDELYVKMTTTGSARLWQHPDKEYPAKADVVYKIRRQSDGLFSTGGAWPDFNTRGKIWRQRGHLTNHLRQVNADRSHEYQKCDIVAFEIVEKEVEKTTVGDYLLERDAIARKRKEEQDRRQKVAREAAELRELKKLAAKLGKNVV